MSTQVQADRGESRDPSPSTSSTRSRDQVATIWLNRPEVKNCVNWGLLVQMGEAVEKAGADDDVRSCSSAAAATRSARAPT